MHSDDCATVSEKHRPPLPSSCQLGNFSSQPHQKEAVELLNPPSPPFRGIRSSVTRMLVNVKHQPVFLPTTHILRSQLAADDSAAASSRSARTTASQLLIRSPIAVADVAYAFRPTLISPANYRQLALYLIRRARAPFRAQVGFVMMKVGRYERGLDQLMKFCDLDGIAIYWSISSRQVVGSLHIASPTQLYTIH